MHHPPKIFFFSLLWRFFIHYAFNNFKWKNRHMLKLIDIFITYAYTLSINFFSTVRCKVIIMMKFFIFIPHIMTAHTCIVDRDIFMLYNSIIVVAICPFNKLLHIHIAKLIKWIKRATKKY